MAESPDLNRRAFLTKSLSGCIAISGFSSILQGSNFLQSKEEERLCIVYTNDTHSRIEPFPANDPKHPGEGGFAKRAGLIRHIRSLEKNVMVLDAGDIFQGTPYFNEYKGELEYKLMSAMGYDAVTLGNHDFDLGMENLVLQRPHASFDFLNCNYDVRNTPLQGYIKPYQTYRKGRKKIGVYGMGIQLEGLIDKKHREGLLYLDPVAKGNETAAILKKDEKCDLVIALSHLGYTSETGKINDVTYAQQSRYTDIILGGHTHTFLQKPSIVANAEKKKVFICQVGWAGIWLGELQVVFNSTSNEKTVSSTMYNVHQTIIG